MLRLAEAKSKKLFSYFLYPQDEFQIHVLATDTWSSFSAYISFNINDTIV